MIVCGNMKSSMTCLTIVYFLGCVLLVPLTSLVLKKISFRYLQTKFTGCGKLNHILARKQAITETNDLKPQIAIHLESHFNSKMKNSNVPLLKDFSTYSKSLPVRSYLGEYMQLYRLSYYARPKDLTDMVIAINQPQDARYEVRYISAPSRSGKTASVLPAFLSNKTTKLIKQNGTHYLYLAFSNNDDRSFTSIPNSPSPEFDIAMQQGAAFIFECVKTLLERPDDLKSYKIKIEESPELSVGNVTQAMSKYLFAKLGKDCNIWFHVDEHRQMCNQSPNAKGDGAAFSRGAMESLARLSCAKVIATYIERPKSIPTSDSSQVCRVSIALPPIDVNQVMKNVKELSIDSSNFDLEKMRKLSSLKVRLGLKLKEIDFISVLHKRGTKPITETFLKSFEKAKNGPMALEKCNKICKFSFKKKGIGTIDDIATELLLGIPDDDKKERQFSDVVSLTGNLITVTIERLLQTVDPKVQVYNIGSNLFENSLTNTDLLSSTPLEAAYYWTLSCRSAVRGRIRFDDNIVFSITCDDLKPGRLFPGTDNSTYDLKFLQQNTIYYAYERRNGSATHLLADLFFITDNKELVLVDITGGGNTLMLEKKRKLVSWIKKEQIKIEKYKLRGVVLAPNVCKEKKTDNNDLVSVISGESAKELLGGLRQIALWSEET